VHALTRFHHYFLRWIGTNRMGASLLMLPPLHGGARVRSMCIPEQRQVGILMHILFS
jgi:hypothetical protein